MLLSPSRFLKDPASWLRAISRHRATTSGAPNFAYDLCVEKIPEESRAALDLASWRVAYNGAEPVRAESLRRFRDAGIPGLGLLARAGMWLNVRLGREKDRLSPETRTWLHAFFREDVERLSALIGRDLSHWLTPSPPARAAAGA